jgi:hypothetical protein
MDNQNEVDLKLFTCFRFVHEIVQDDGTHEANFGANVRAACDVPREYMCSISVPDPWDSFLPTGKRVGKTFQVETNIIA